MVNGKVEFGCGPQLVNDCGDEYTFRNVPMTVTYALKWMRAKAKQKMLDRQLRRQREADRDVQKAANSCPTGQIPNGKGGCENCAACPSNRYRTGCKGGTVKQGKKWVPKGEKGTCKKCDKCPKWKVRTNCGADAGATGAKVTEKGMCVKCQDLCAPGKYPKTCAENKAGHNDPQKASAVTHAPGSRDYKSAADKKSLCLVCPPASCPTRASVDYFVDYSKTCTWPLHSSIKGKLTPDDWSAGIAASKGCAPCAKRFQSDIVDCSTGTCRKKLKCKADEALLGCGGASPGQCKKLDSIDKMPQSVDNVIDDFKACAQFGKPMAPPYTVKKNPRSAFDAARTAVSGEAWPNAAAAVKAFWKQACRTMLVRCECIGFGSFGWSAQSSGLLAQVGKRRACSNGFQPPATALLTGGFGQYDGRLTTICKSFVSGRRLGERPYPGSLATLAHGAGIVAPAAWPAARVANTSSKAAAAAGPWIGGAHGGTARGWPMATPASDPPRAPCLGRRCLPRKRHARTLVPRLKAL